MEEFMCLALFLQAVILQIHLPLWVEKDLNGGQNNFFGGVRQTAFQHTTLTPQQIYNCGAMRSLNVLTP